ncbi:MAG: IPT/TIG domain-containing protein [Candidatus Dormibacteria bacterium]
MTPNPTTWGSLITINGTGFIGVSAITVHSATTTASTALSSWSVNGTATAIEVQLPLTAPSADTGWNVIVQTVELGVTSTCQGSLTLAAPATTGGGGGVGGGATAGGCSLSVTPSPAGWNSMLQITGSGFGPPSPDSYVSLDQGVTSMRLAAVWSPTAIVAMTPASGADGQYQLVVHAGSAVCEQPLQVSSAVASTGIGCAMTAEPNPATWGQSLVLTGVGFGSASGTVGIHSNAGSANLTVTVWSPTEVVAALPATATPPDGTYTVVLQPAAGGSSCTASVTIQGASANAKPFVPSLPALSSDPLLILDDAAQAARRLVAAAGRAGSKWRYDYLRAEAEKAAEHVSTYEAEIFTLMQLAVAKVAAAEELLNPALMQAVSNFQNDAQSLSQLAQSQDLNGIVSDLADKATSALLLEEVVTWLTTHDVIAFWIGLFDAMIDDLGNFDAPSLPRTNAYLDAQFDGPDLGAAVQASAQALLQRLDDEVDAFAAPLRAAAAEVIAGTSQAMKEVFGDFDLPLTEKGAPGGAPDLGDVDPLATLENQLNSAVEALIAQIKTAMRAILSVIDEVRKKFKELMIDFLVLPILVVLAIGFALGPFGAALLAAVVLIAIEELAHLILSWLTGPLLDEVQKAKAAVLQTVAKLQSLLAGEAGMISATDPAAYFHVVASELRELKDLLPEAYLDAVAGLLGEARDVVLQDALQLAHSAEQSLGLENASAFDAIAYDYQSHLPVAPQLPGGSDKNFLSGAAILRDLGRLDRQRVGVLDGKEVEITHRLSVQALLGGDQARFLQFLQNGRLLIDLTGDVLLDSRFPGVYRALIKEVRVAGLFPGTDAGIAPASGLPVAVTHLGESRTRVKKGANSTSPPIQLPDCVPNENEFLYKLLGVVRPSPWELRSPLVRGLAMAVNP